MAKKQIQIHLQILEIQFLLLYMRENVLPAEVMSVICMNTMMNSAISIISVRFVTTRHMMKTNCMIIEDVRIELLKFNS